MLRGKDQVERENQHQQVRGLVYDDTTKCCRGSEGCWSPFGCSVNYIHACHAEAEETKR